MIKMMENITKMWIYSSCIEPDFSGSKHIGYSVDLQRLQFWFQATSDQTVACNWKFLAEHLLRLPFCFVVPGENKIPN